MFQIFQTTTQKKALRTLFLGHLSVSIFFFVAFIQGLRECHRGGHGAALVTSMLWKAGEWRIHLTLQARMAFNTGFWAHLEGHPT